MSNQFQNVDAFFFGIQVHNTRQLSSIGTSYLFSVLHGQRTLVVQPTVNNTVGFLDSCACYTNDLDTNMAKPPFSGSISQVDNFSWKHVETKIVRHLSDHTKFSCFSLLCRVWLSFFAIDVYSYKTIVISAWHARKHGSKWRLSLPDHFLHSFSKYRDEQQPGLHFSCKIPRSPVTLTLIFAEHVWFQNVLFTGKIFLFLKQVNMFHSKEKYREEIVFFVVIFRHLPRHFAKDLHRKTPDMFYLLALLGLQTSALLVAVFSSLPFSPLVPQASAQSYEVLPYFYLLKITSTSLHSVKVCFFSPHNKVVCWRHFVFKLTRDARAPRPTWAN